MKNLTFLFLFLTTISFAQDFSGYKYASVPTRFSFSREDNQYNLNALTKMFLEQLGFQTFLTSDNLPKEFIENNCNKVFVDVHEANNMFSTKLTVVLKDCQGKVIFTSIEGVSKEKSFTTSYNLALREALNSMKGLKHTYKEKSNGYLDEAIDIKPISETKITENKVTGQLFAQPITNGFQLIDSTPKVILKIFKTSNSEVYIANKGNLSGILFSKNNEWFFEYYQNDKLNSEKIEVKF